jgi:hypothetical protein
MPNKIVIGKTTFRSAYADSNALWKVISSRGEGVYICEIVNEQIVINEKVYDGDYAGVQQSFLEEEIIKRLAIKKLLANSKRNAKKFYDNLNVGDIVHYKNGSGQYVRCRVVSNKKDKELLPFELVGNWRDYDLPKRLCNGSIDYKYYPSQILNKISMRPNASNIWEYSRKGEDPKDLKPIDLNVPEPTEEQAKIASKWVLIEEIQNIISNNNDPDVVLNFISSKLFNRNNHEK